MTWAASSIAPADRRDLERRRCSAEFTAKVAPKTFGGERKIDDLASKHGVHHPPSIAWMWIGMEC